MDSTQKVVLNKLDELDKIYKKASLLEKKKERMGLTDEETELLKDKWLEYYFKYDDMVEGIADYLVKNLMTERAKRSLRNIQKLIPWGGGMILTDLEYHQIIASAGQLRDEDFDYLEEQLQILHSEVFDSFEDFAATDNGVVYCTEMAKVISAGSSEDVLKVVDYLDDRYREFGNLLGLELEELDVVFED